MAGTPLNLGARVGGFLLSPGDVDANFATRAKVFSAIGGWDPQP
jgi:pectate lyase